MANEGIITLNDLQNKFKAAGVYTVYRDQTVSANIQSSGPIRLIFGFSKYGIFNTPVYIEKGDVDTAERLFGKLDYSLERKGSFFHRSLRVALSEGPVLALNLLKLNNEINTDTGLPTSNTDLVSYKSFSTDVIQKNGSVTNKLFASYYDKERFWKPSKSYLLATRSNQDQGKLLTLTNLSQTPLSFIIRKSEVRGYDITVKEWYADKEIPKYLKPNDLIKDYFIDIIAVYGDFGPSKYQNLSVDPIYGKYFTPNGLVVANLQDFLNRPEIKLVDVFTGSMIPDFKDKNNVSQYIETIVNAKTRLTGIMCAVDKKEFDKYEDDTNSFYLDLVGHRFLNDNSTADCEFLSYKKKILQDYTYTKSLNNPHLVFTTTGLTIDNSVPKKITVAIAPSHPRFAWAQKIEKGDYFNGATTSAGTNYGITLSNPVLEVVKIVKTPTSVVFDLSSPLKENETLSSGSFVDLYQLPSVVETLSSAIASNVKLGNVGDKVKLKAFDGISEILLGSYTLATGDATGDLISGLSTNVNSGSHGFSVTPSSPDAHVKAPVGTFDLPNTEYKLIIEIEPVNGVANSNTMEFSTTEFSGGAGQPAGYNWEFGLKRMVIDGTDTFYLADKKSQMWIDYKNGNLTNGDKMSDGTNNYYIKMEEVRATGGLDAVDDFRLILKVSLFTDADLTAPISAGDVIQFGDSFDSSGFGVTGSDKINFISLVGALNERFQTTSIVNSNIIRLAIADEPKVKIGQYLVGLDTNDEKILTRIISIKRIKNGAGIPTDIEVTTADKIKVFTTPSSTNEVERYYPVVSFFDVFDFTVLEGFKLKESHMPNNTNERMKEILSVMTDTNMYKALIDPEMIDFRYLVDTFNHGLETQSKRKLSRLVKDRSKCLGILNSPSIKEFKESADPRFTETPSAVDPLPVLNVEYINKGANLDENPSFLYTLPEEEDGASYVGFFCPNIIVKDDDDVSFPPAALVSNNFMKKYNGGNPFMPVAGPRRGILTGDGLVGVEYPFDNSDRGFLEEKGINPIYMKKDGTIQIMGNETSYKRFKSVLNQLNTRDLLVSIEIEHTAILSQYEFEYNNDTMRGEVDTLLRDYLGTLKNAYKALTDFDVIFDRNNNPNFVLREGAAIVDVVVEPADVSKKFIQRITLRKGSNPSIGGFVAI